MNINYSAISIIDMLGLVQGLVLGLLLIFMNKKKKSTLFLGLFILVYALELLPSVLSDWGVTAQYPQWYALPFNFGWLLFPLFFVYVQQISILSAKKPSYWTLIPGILFFILSCILFLQTPDFKRTVHDSLGYDLIDLGGVLYSIYIGLKTLKWIKKHIYELKNQYTAIEFRDLKWARLYVILGLAFTFSVVIADEFNTGFYFDLVVSIVNVVLLYWISIRGIMQQNIATLVGSDNLSKSGTNTKRMPTITDADHDRLIEQINHYVQSTEAFTQVDLTIVDLATRLGIHPKRISGALNSRLQQNFNSYINAFRIKKAVEMLENNTAESWSIDGIANAVGFRSRSSFYTAFKKNTGTTPSHYTSI